MTTNRIAIMLSVALAAGAARAETIEGTVEYAGQPPAPKAINKQSDPYCAKKPASDPSVLAANGRLQNVWVRVTKGAPDQPGAPDRVVEVSQRDCMYEPRVAAIQAGNTLKMTNGDPVLHNVHAYAGVSTVFNRAMPGNGGPPLTFDRNGARPTSEWEGVMKWKCDVHPWMLLYVAVAKNPYFATTNAQGEFRIEGIPPGDYTVAAWHERLGERTAELKVEQGKPARLVFRFGGSERAANP